MFYNFKKHFTLWSVLSMLLLLAFCRKENLQVIEVPSELAYASLVIDGAYGTADTSSAPTVNWNNQEGTYELVAPYPNGFALNSSTGKVSWSPNVQDSTYSIKVRAKNNAGNSQPVTLTVNIKPQKPSNLNYAVNQIQILSLPTATGDTTSVAASVSWGSKKAGYYQIDSGAFAGLKINKQNGVLSIPKNTKKATYLIKIRAYNTVGESEAVVYKLIVAPTFYQVTFDVNGGSTTQSKDYVQTIADGLNATAPNTSPQKVGFTFEGWFIASNGGTAVTTFGPIVQATTYYAQYTLAVPSALKYNPDSATNDFGIAGQSAIPTVITGDTPVRYAMTTLPVTSGISIDAITGQISWTNTVPVGTYEITITPRNRDDVNSNGTPVKYKLRITDFAPKNLVYSPASVASDFGKSGSSVVPTIDSGGVSVRYAMTTLPVTSGISIDTLTGKISWADTVIVRAYNLQITPRNIKSAGTSIPYTLTINAVKPSAFVYSKDTAIRNFGTADASFTPTINDGGAAVTYTISGNPSGVSINAVGQISWTDKVLAGTYPLTITATNSAGSTMKSYTLTIKAIVPSAFSYSKDTAIRNFGTADTSFTPTIKNGGAPVSYSIISSPVPAGVSINANTGQILWTDKVFVGIYSFRVIARNEAATIGADYGLTIKAVKPSGLAYSTDSKTSNFGTADASFTPTINDGGAAVTYTISGNPSGVSINAVGQISWTDKVLAGTYPLTITATNSAGSTMKSYTLTIKALALSNFSYSKDSSIRNFGTADTSFTPTIQNGGAPVSYSIISSPVPAGVSINANTGQISWTDKVPVGIYSFRVIARNEAATIGADYGLTIKAVKPSGLAYSTDSKTSNFGTADASVTPSINDGGAASVIYAISGNPSGVTIDASTGIISWTDKVLAGTYPLTITATNSAGSITASYALTIKALALSNFSYSKDSSIRNFGTADTSFTPTIQNGGAPVSYSIISSPVPAGVSINANTGQISWTDKVFVGIYSFRVIARNEAATIGADYGLTIKAVKPSGLAYSKDSSIRNFGTADASVTPSINNGGAASVIYAISGNPSGVTIDASTGIISWTDKVLAGTYPLTITPTNSAGAGNPVFYILTINAIAPKDLVYNPNNATTTTTTTGSSATPSINNGGAFVTYAISSFTKDEGTSTSGSPTGVSINATTGQILWTDGVAVGTYKLTITATNSAGAGTPAVYTLTLS